MANKQGIKYSLRECFGNTEKYSAHTIAGNKVNLDDLSRRIAIKLSGLHELDVRRVIGQFKSPGDVFTQERHKIKVNITGSKSLVEGGSKNTKVCKQIMKRRTPIIEEICDLGNSSCNSSIMAGSYVRIEGESAKRHFPFPILLPHYTLVHPKPLINTPKG